MEFDGVFTSSFSTVHVKHVHFACLLRGALRT